MKIRTFIKPVNVHLCLCLEAEKASIHLAMIREQLRQLRDTIAVYLEAEEKEKTGT